MRRTLRLPGTVDSSPIYLHNARVAGRIRDVFVATTSYGITLAIDAASGRELWRFTPSSAAALEGGPQITNATPVADPDRRFVYAASPNGLIHKLALSDGSEDRSGSWPVSVTRDAGHEKLAAALNIDGADATDNVAAILLSLPVVGSKSARNATPRTRALRGPIR